MAERKRNKIEREADLEKISALYLQGYTQAEIAFQLSLHQTQISYDLKELQKRWQKSAARSFDQAKGEELAKIDELERVYWDAWRRSRGTVKVKSTDREKIVLDEENKIHKGAEALGVAGQDGEIVRTSVRREKRVGEGKYLDGAQWCIQQRMKIFGLQAPIKSKTELTLLPKQYIGLDLLVEQAKTWTDNETEEETAGSTVNKEGGNV